MADDSNKLLTAILERMVRVETKIDGLADVKDVAEKANETANQALSLSKNNVIRLDKIDKIIFWAGTTITGSVILALIGVVLKVG